jgi:AcrR family transcriptional regulator
MTSTRERIVGVAARLLAEGGPDAVSTRAVSAAAGIQAPTIYRLFGDKQGLLDAVASDGFRAHVRRKAGVRPSADPVADLRAGWDQNVGFGLANPELYLLIVSAYRPGASSPAATEGREMLAALIHRIAEAARLRIPEPRAAQLVHAAGSGTTLALIATPEEQRDLALSEVAREAVIAAITTDPPNATARGPAGAAIALRALLPQTDALTEPEGALLNEWLTRIADVPLARSKIA